MLQTEESAIVCNIYNIFRHLLTQCRYWNLISKHLRPYVRLKYQTHFLGMLSLCCIWHLSMLEQEKIYMQRWILSTFCLKEAYYFPKILSLEKAPKRKTSDFHPLRSFCARKKCCLCGLAFAYFCFVSWFLLVSVFFTLKIFSYKKIEIVLITSYTILLKYTPITHPIENLFPHAYVHDSLHDFFYIIIC